MTIEQAFSGRMHFSWMKNAFLGFALSIPAIFGIFGIFGISGNSLSSAASVPLPSKSSCFLLSAPPLIRGAFLALRIHRSSQCLRLRDEFCLFRSLFISFYHL